MAAKESKHTSGLISGNNKQNLPASDALERKKELGIHRLFFLIYILNKTNRLTTIRTFKFCSRYKFCFRTFDEHI